jgi:hypothetical protein
MIKINRFSDRLKFKEIKKWNSSPYSWHYFS